MAASTIRRAQRIIRLRSARAAALVYLVTDIEVRALRYTAFLWQWLRLAPCRWYTIYDVRTQTTHRICVRLFEIERRHSRQRWILRGIVVDERPTILHHWRLYAAVQITFDETRGFGRIGHWPGWADRDALARGTLSDRRFTYCHRELRDALWAS